ncbi:MAG: hypothetical protein OJF50_006745 [Nitrospira sp.]|jgi:hypothetical protein|nr:hypothetical protein [Nitrospira sp.]
MMTPKRFRIRTYRRASLQGTVFFLNDELKARGFIWNLSPNGCRVDAEREVPAGTEVSMLLNLPAGGPEIEVHSAVVAWSRGHELGFRIDEIQPLQANRLKRYLREAS